MMRRLSDPHREGWDYLQRLETYDEPNTYGRGIYRRPTNGKMVRFLLQPYTYRLQQKVSTLAEQWVVGGPLLRRTVPAEQDGSTFVFFEDYSYREGEGSISCAELRPNGIGEPRTALTGPDHLAYPSLFQWRGEWFMIPETGARRRVEIWRARRFPDEWALRSQSSATRSGPRGPSAWAAPGLHGRSRLNKVERLTRWLPHARRVSGT
jgi:hypothetical protein